MSKKRKKSAKSEIYNNFKEVDSIMINYKSLNKILAEFNLPKANMKNKDKNLIKVFVSKGDYIYRLKFKDYIFENRTIQTRKLYFSKETFESHKILEKLLINREERSFKFI